MEAVSVIIPVFNSERRLPALLASLRSQTIDQQAVELIVIDDDSTDSTVSIAESFGARIIRNGARHIERGKALGMAAASHDLLFFIDDDNRLPHAEWLENAMRALAEHPEGVGVQAAWFSYRRADPPANRYCSLYGIGDPMAFYLRRRDHLMRTERAWTIAGRVVQETDRYWIVEFTAQNFPTIGSQGYLTRRSLLSSTSWWPDLFHIDCNYDLVLRGHTQFIILKDEIIHEYCQSVGQLVRKCRRNMFLFLRDSHIRRFRWQTPKWYLVFTVLRMVTIAGPALRAASDYFKTQDPACFLHPIVSFIIPTMYAVQVIAFRLTAARRSTPR